MAGRRQDHASSVNDAANETLLRHGIKVDADAGLFFVSNSHTAIASMLVNSPWASNWCRILKRLDNALSAPNSMRFGASVQSRAVGIPLAEVLDDGLVGDGTFG